MRVIIASNNAHKVSEIKTALDFPGWTFETLREAGLSSDPEESADTFEGNARIKAQAVKALVPDAAVLADDSGLAVDALGGAPGVYSSRYAGEDGNDAANNAKLLKELEGVADADRTARFVCTLVFIDPEGRELVSTGTVEGRIGYRELGDQGFGYDPLFFPDAFCGQRTFAEVSQEEKNSLSHRGNALRGLREKISSL